MIIDIDCPLCRGEGRIETGEMESGPAGVGFEAIDCPRCGGTGAVAHDLNEDCDDDDEQPIAADGWMQDGSWRP